MNNSTKQNVCYLLTRSYRWRSKHHYLLLVMRNRAAKKVLSRHFKNLEFVIFHESSLLKIDMYLIMLLSNMWNLKFIDISSDFSVPDNFIWTGKSEFPLGYSLMCRFHYFHVWKYLKHYEWAIRIDEDCIIESIPDVANLRPFTVGAISSETHSRTNQTLPVLLKEVGADGYYDHKFPYTNVFITQTKYWLQKEVQEFFSYIASDIACLENRWGDLPILGVASKDRKSTRLNYSHVSESRMPSSA